jgi:hypothetical protein
MRFPAMLPGSLARRSGSGNLLVRSGVAYSYAIGGLPFMSAASIEHPIIRETAPVRKEQFDNQTLPGEQTLEYWWIRSQHSFHGGAGQVFADPTEGNPFNAIRFRTSRNVDVWTQGEVSLLRVAETINGGTAVPGLLDATEFTFVDGEHAAAAVAATHIHFVTSDDYVSHELSVTTVAESVTSDGSHLFVAAQDGVWSAPMPADFSTAPSWTQEYDFSTSDPVFMAFVKQRLILAVGPALYELAPHPDTPPAVLPTALFTEVNDNWEWTGITEVAGAILVAGNAAGVRGAILRLTLGTDGDLPTLTSAATAAQLPFGEVPYSIVGYLGRFVGIGTNKGVRVGVADSLGGVEYGPLLFETTAPVRAWSARDRFLWCTVSRGNEGDSGLYRIDLSTELAELRFSYATDLVVDGDTTDCNVIAHIGASDQVFFATATDGYRESVSSLAEFGTLRTSRIRFNTIEPKVFKLIRVRGPVLKGSLAIQTVDQGDNLASSHTFSAGTSPGLSDVKVTVPSEPIDFMSLQFTFNRQLGLNGAVMWAYQLKALPGTPRQRLIQLPLWCFDWEIDRFGQRRGGDGTAWRRVRALEEVDRLGDTVVLQDFDIGENVECVIERVNFEQTAPPPKFQGWGGILTVTLRST